MTNLCPECGDSSTYISTTYASKLTPYNTHYYQCQNGHLWSIDQEGDE